MAQDGGLLYPTGYESAVIGVASRWGEQFLVLDFEKVIEGLLGTKLLGWRSVCGV
jgi:hypothetical protein